MTGMSADEKVVRDGSPLTEEEPQSDGNPIRLIVLNVLRFFGTSWRRLWGKYRLLMLGLPAE
jgi:hypothetical protein